MSDDVRWTNKLPALVAGVILILAGLLASSRRATAAAIILIALGAGFVGYSLTIKDWCEVKGMAWGDKAFGQGGFGHCWKQKGYFSF
jgi:hypothetical protein